MTNFNDVEKSYKLIMQNFLDLAEINSKVSKSVIDYNNEVIKENMEYALNNIAKVEKVDDIKSFENYFKNYQNQCQAVAKKQAEKGFGLFQDYVSEVSNLFSTVAKEQLKKTTQAVKATAK